MPVHPAELEVRAFALTFPETHEDFPWGHRLIKVRGKAFVFMSNDEPDLSVSVKLPWSSEGALQFPFCEPTHYGMGQHGWVTASFPAGMKRPKVRPAGEWPPLPALRSWIEESYRAVAPKKLVKALDEAQAERTAALLEERRAPKARKAPAAKRSRSVKAAKARAARRG
ncbi:MAG: MmcQ/YjbR family DNA-binding protein [Anaeromyxobacter sp.]